MAGATSLLLLSHTPVSRKVFQYFHCHNIGGREFLRADYDIMCTSPAYYLYMPFVLVVLAGFTILLPAVILFYLFRHRKNLYSTQVHQRIGWLYDPYVRGAEFWQVHDLLMKMLLTGVLIYVPTTSRAGIAILICLIAIANLNYFQPHKNVILFWLTQISFVTTASKYVVALLLSASMDKNELKLVGTLLIGLDIFFMCSSFLAVLMSLMMLRAKVSAINEQSKIKDLKNTSVKVTPILKDTTTTGSSKSSDGNIVEQIHAIEGEYYESESIRNTKMNKDQRDQRRTTQLRVEARHQVRQTKALCRVPLFKDVAHKAIEHILELTTFKKCFKGDILFEQGDAAKDFYIIVTGECSVEKCEKDANGNAVKKQVDTLKDLDYIGESALFGESGGGGSGGEEVESWDEGKEEQQQPRRESTVTVLSDHVECLMLSREHFNMLVEEGVLTRQNKTTQNLFRKETAGQTLMPLPKLQSLRRQFGASSPEYLEAVQVFQSQDQQ